MGYSPIYTEEPKNSQKRKYNLKKLVGFFFRSQLIIYASLGLMTVAILLGDAFAYYTDNAITELGTVLMDYAGELSIPVALILSAVIFTGPLHYYADFNNIEMLLIFLFIFFIVGIAIGHSFKNPLWSFLGGIVIMTSYCIFFTSTIGLINGITGQMLPMSIYDIVYSLMEGLYDMEYGLLLVTTSIENGAVLGLFSAFWGVVFMNGKQKTEYNAKIVCGDDGFCEM